MEQISNELRVGWVDPGINRTLGSIGAEAGAFSRHFTQGEDFFLRLPRPFEVPQLPIHHDVRRPAPVEDYLFRLRGVIAQLAVLVPEVLRGLTYYFDPAEILKPCFFQVYQVKGAFFLYLLRLDLAPKSTGTEVLQRGTNDLTARYRTRELFLEPVVIPLAEVVRSEGRIATFRVLQAVSQTWIGEYGRGYFQQGVWMDLDLTKFFSRLFLPPGAHCYPFYPYQCRYMTICEGLIGLSAEARLAAVPWLHRILGMLLPEMERIQGVMRTASFSEDLPLFRELKVAVPAAWYEPWRGLHVEAYLNEDDRREYRIDG